MLLHQDMPWCGPDTPSLNVCVQILLNCDLDSMSAGLELCILACNVRPPWPNGQGVGLLIRRLRVRVPQGVILCCIAICNFGTQQFASSPLLFLLRLPFQHRLLVSATALVFILCHIGEKPAPAKTCETHCRPFRGTCQSLFAKPIIRRHMPIIVHQGMSHFARVVKGVDLRSTAGNCAWVRTPQVTF